MESIVNGDMVDIDFNQENDEYRISLFDNYYHFADEITMTSEQFNELVAIIKDLKITCNKDDM